MEQVNNDFFERMKLDFKSKTHPKGLDNPAQARAILDRAKLLAPRSVGITYSANHGQTLALYAYYQNPTPANWLKVKALFKSSSNQGAVMRELLNLLDTPEYSSLKNNFQILPISTMAAGGGSPQDSWVAQNLNHIHQFVERGGRVLGWQNQYTREGNFAIGGGVAAGVFTDEQNSAVQTYLSRLESASKSSSPLPSIKSMMSDLKWDDLVQLSPVSEISTHLVFQESRPPKSPAPKKIGFFTRKKAQQEFLHTLDSNLSDVQKFLSWLENFYCNQYLAQQGPKGVKKKGTILGIVEDIKSRLQDYDTLEKCLAAKSAVSGDSLQTVIEGHRRKGQRHQTWGWKTIQEKFLPDDMDDMPNIEDYLPKNK